MSVCGALNHLIAYADWVMWFAVRQTRRRSKNGWWWTNANITLRSAVASGHRTRINYKKSVVRDDYIPKWKKISSDTQELMIFPRTHMHTECCVTPLPPLLPQIFALSPTQQKCQSIMSREMCNYFVLWMGKIVLQSQVLSARCQCGWAEKSICAAPLHKQLRQPPIASRSIT